MGQSFLARDTLITQLTVWRPPNDRSVIGAKLFITGVDTTWVPPRPDVQIMLLDGPTLTVYDSDPPGQLIPMRYVIDPPLALPRPGLYAFFVQAEGCWAGESHRLIADSSNDYPYGIYWVTGRALDPCYLRGVSGGEDNTDLCFEVQYCVDVTTRVRRHTWGELKLLYR